MCSAVMADSNTSAGEGLFRFQSDGKEGIEQPRTSSISALFEVRLVGKEK